MCIRLVYLMILSLFLGIMSCTPDSIEDTTFEQPKPLASDPPSEDPGEPVDPNG
ncbi:hypothetical protein [Flavivirga jejuensis]|uniref:Secreted protein n=1 Tax=Flavivirga jejuensis TaxID=870487 RepID=A0ABT8WUQ6_9FLAO|nr:hypothetical protein [Flavivirga jejuensis]MDO5976918.1 hypothetical protein [Flavivirga jejuensis]